MKYKLRRTISAAMMLLLLAGCTPSLPDETSALEADVTPEPTKAAETTAEATTEEETTEEVKQNGKDTVENHK